MAANGTLTAKVRANTRDFDSGMKRANTSLASLRRSVSSMRNMAITIGVTVAARAAVRTLKDAVMQAVNLGETVNKANVLFGESYEDILKWSRTTTAALALTQQQILDISAGFKGSLFARGITDVNTAKWLTELSGDLASFFNTTASDAAQALSGVLRGEYDMAERYNIFINEAAIKEEARRLGIVKTNRELTAQEKTLAAISIIDRQTADAQGDLARTSNSTANQIRQLQIHFANLKVTIGKVFQPLLDYWLPGINKYLSELFNPEDLEERIASWSRVVMDWNLQLRDTFLKTKDVIVAVFDILGSGVTSQGAMGDMWGQSAELRLIQAGLSPDAAAKFVKLTQSIDTLLDRFDPLISAWMNQPAWLKTMETIFLTHFGPAGIGVMASAISGAVTNAFQGLSQIISTSVGGAIGGVFAKFTERGSTPLNPLFVVVTNEGVDVDGGGGGLWKKTKGLFAGAGAAAAWAGRATLAAAGPLAGLAGVLVAPIAAAWAGLEVWKKVDPEGFEKVQKNQANMAGKIAEGNVTSEGTSHYLQYKLTPKVDRTLDRVNRIPVAPVQPAIPGMPSAPSNGSSYPSFGRAMPNVYIDGKQVATQVTPAVVRNMSRTSGPVIYSPFLAGGAA
jgi:hypothetical protein